MPEEPNPTATPPAAAPPTPAAGAPASPASTPPPDSDGWIDEQLERNPGLALGINRLMETFKADPGVLTRLEGVFNPAPPAPSAPTPTLPAAATTPPATVPSTPDITAQVLAALGGKEALDSLKAAATREAEREAKADMDRTYGRLTAEAKPIALRVHPTYFEGAIGDAVARLGVERSLRTGERLEVATEAEAKAFLAASGEIGKKYVEALDPGGRRLILTAGLQGGPPPNFDPSKMTNKQQEDAFAGMLSDEMTKARFGL